MEADLPFFRRLPSAQGERLRETCEKLHDLRSTASSLSLQLGILIIEIFEQLKTTKDEETTILQYCQTTTGYSMNYIHRLEKAGRLTRFLRQNSFREPLLPTNESQIRELASYLYNNNTRQGEQAIVEIWQTAIRSAKENNNKKKQKNKKKKKKDGIIIQPNHVNKAIEVYKQSQQGNYSKLEHSKYISV